MERPLRSKIIVKQIAGYSALPSQEQFHLSQARFKGFSGPIGSGKSQALCWEAYLSAIANPGRMGLIGAPTYQMLRDTTQKAMLDTLEINKIPFKFTKSENSLVFTSIKSKVLFRSVDDFEHLRGTNLAWFGLDELTYIQEEAWLRLEGRLRDPLGKRHRGFAVWTPKGYDWVYRKFLRDESDSYHVTLAKPYENKHLLSVVPDFYDRLKKSYDSQFFEQEVMGSYLSLSGGRVYRNFARDEHLRTAEIDVLQPLLWALDFNVDPMCSLVVQMKDGVAHVVDEIVIPRASTQMACEEFFGRYSGHAKGLRIYGDASGNNEHTSGSTDYKIINNFFRARVGLIPQQCVPRSNPLVRERISLVNSWLKNADGGISLYVDPKCKELIQDFEELSFKEGTMIPDKAKDSRRSHLSDALGYLLWQESNTGGAGEKTGRMF